MILQLGTFDYLTAPAVRLVNTAPLWAALPRLSPERPLARLLAVADTLRREDILAGFRQVATPEAHLPSGVLACRLDYEEFIHANVQAVRYTRVYLVLDSVLGEDATLALLGAYGVQAWPLDHELPRPFARARVYWDHLQSEDGRYFALLRSRNNQYGRLLHPQTLHSLLAQEFPLWVALQVSTYTAGETAALLRQKSAMALYGEGKTEESRHESALAVEGVQVVREVLARGEALHAARLYVLVDGETLAECRQRQEIVRGACGLDLERVYGAGGEVEELFSGSVRPQPRLFSLLGSDATRDGTPLTTSGVAILAGSALSYRRRTEQRGVMLGVDRNQAPVILNLFDDRAPSYNMVVLGQTGSGKTFAVQLLMMRHLLLGTRLILIDPQGNIDLSFLGQEVYQRSVLGTSQAAVNVLDVVQDEVGGQVELALSLLRILGVHSGQALERALLDEALLTLYMPCFQQGAPSPTLGDLQAAMERQAGRYQSATVREVAERLTLTLGIYTRGSQAALFGRPTSVDFRLEHAVNVYDVSKLPHQGLGGNLRTALLAILVASINQGIRRRRSLRDRAPILFFVDEMGILMRDAVIAEYISSEYKTARARLVGMIVADQDLHSLLGPRDEKGLHHGVPMLANAANVLLFNQKDSERARVQEHFPTLPEKVVEVLPILPRGTCVASLPDDLLIVSVLPSDLERIVFSSRMQDRERAREIVQRLQLELERSR
jgi:hypothetical protein